MADTFEEDDDFTRLVEWLKANGLALAAGIGLGLAVVVGWYWWQAHVDKQAYAAAELHDSLVQRVNAEGFDEAARAELETLKDEYAGSPYAANAAMQLAAHAADQQDYDLALAQLDWVLAESDSTPVRNLARVRKARVLWAAGRDDAALELLREEHPSSFERLYAELTGDIHAARGEPEQAHEAYQQAAAAADSQVGGAMLQRKLVQTHSAEAGPTSDEGA